MFGPTTPSSVVAKFQDLGCTVYKQWMSQQEREDFQKQFEAKQVEQEEPRKPIQSYQATGEQDNKLDDLINKWKKDSKK
jgi:hypothetical protein